LSKANFAALLAPAGTVLEGTPCTVGVILSGLPEDYRTPFENQVNLRYRDGGLTDFELANRMRAAGFKVGDTTVNRHRGGRCTCPQKGN
jgi:hypothetical protein